MSKSVLSSIDIKKFKNFILNYFHRYGRNYLPWRQDHDPYKIMVSEIMLQQTQVERVIPKFTQFLGAFPTVEKLAHASLADVLKQWQGLGYNRRGKYLHQAAQKIVTEFEGVIPRKEDMLLSLPGIGAYTAAAIQAFSFNKPVIIIETNVRTIFLHHFFPNQDKVFDKELIPLVAQTLDHSNPRQWYAALMDYGTYLKSVLPNPGRRSKHYAKQTTFKGSYRQIRGEVIKALALRDQRTYQELLDTITGDKTKLQDVLLTLEKEGFVKKNEIFYALP